MGVGHLFAWSSWALDVLHDVRSHRVRLCPWALRQYVGVRRPLVASLQVLDAPSYGGRRHWALGGLLATASNTWIVVLDATSTSTAMAFEAWALDAQVLLLFLFILCYWEIYGAQAQPHREVCEEGFVEVNLLSKCMKKRVDEPFDGLTEEQLKMKNPVRWREEKKGGDDLARVEKCVGGNHIHHQMGIDNDYTSMGKNIVYQVEGGSDESLEQVSETQSGKIQREEAFITKKLCEEVAIHFEESE
ncbi:hypothetical protein PIB30_080739 [Stylosanthes scabra]|uniref:Uncharacterized protein n=1 Tax=Stylosanthes scabra TaxID=79078 RepID=A0ABU6XTA8_9FABA|nr:hypothetical protein [Stylosanthes scabra]